MKPDNIILEGITGSVAYGLNTPTSDIDIKGVFITPTNQLLGFFPGADTKNHVDPDWCYHEIGKFIELAMKCNPTILEMLFLTEYEKLTEIGKLLVDNRHLFLSNIARKSYGGYCMSQAQLLNRRGDSYGDGKANRYEKHTRHLFRLLQQGSELLQTGKITVKVNNRDELFAYGKLPPEEVVTLFGQKLAEFDAIKSILPDVPDKKAVSDLLVKIRKENW